MFTKPRITSLHNTLLTICLLLILAICLLSISAPLRFDRKKEQREELVIQRMKQLRMAEERYCKRFGQYCDTLENLVKAGLLADSMLYIPFSEGKKFEVETTVLTTKTGKKQPLMECRAAYEDYLTGLDEAAIAELSVKAYEAGDYPGLRFGDLETPNNNAGNWE